MPCPPLSVVHSGGRPLVFAVAVLALGLGWTGAAEPEHESLEGSDWPGLTFHAPPKRLAPEAVTEPWPRFLGPHDNGVSRETPILTNWPESGPPKVWEARKGSGYTSPSIARGVLVLFHRIGDSEQIDGLHPETGRRFWSHRYPVEYRDRYGYNDGPRASPVIDGARVYLLGVAAALHCLDLATGRVLWKRDLRADFRVPQNFFGAGPSPLVYKDLLILNLGGRDPDGESLCVAALDKHTGAFVWGVPGPWGASYASPVTVALRGKDRILVLAGGESRPPDGGLLCIDPSDGAVDFRFPWRSGKYESVNASTPVAIDSSRVFISECYSRGGVLLEIGEDLQPRPVWTARDFGMHWSTPLFVDGHLYGYQGRNEPDAFLACLDATTGEERWREALEWDVKVKDPRGRERTFRWGMFRGSLLRVDNRFVALGELGTLALLDLNPEGAAVRRRADLFHARETWSLPPLHRGLLYVSQHSPDLLDDTPPRLICYDLRGE